MAEVLVWAPTILSILKTCHLILKSTMRHTHFYLCFRDKETKALNV